MNGLEITCPWVVWSCSCVSLNPPEGRTNVKYWCGHHFNSYTCTIATRVFKLTFRLLVWRNTGQAVVKILLVKATPVIVSCCQKVLGSLLFRVPARYKLGCPDSSFLFLIFLISSYCWMIYFQLGQQILSSRAVVINFLLYIHLLGWWHVAIFILPSDTSICCPTSSHSLSHLKVYWSFIPCTSYSREGGWQFRKVEHGGWHCKAMGAGGQT